MLSPFVNMVEKKHDGEPIHLKPEYSLTMLCDCGLSWISSSIYYGEWVHFQGKRLFYFLFCFLSHTKFFPLRIDPI